MRDEKGRQTVDVAVIMRDDIECERCGEKATTSLYFDNLERETYCHGCFNKRINELKL